VYEKPGTADTCGKGQELAKAACKYYRDTRKFCGLCDLYQRKKNLCNHGPTLVARSPYEEACTYFTNAGHKNNGLDCALQVEDRTYGVNALPMMDNVALFDQMFDEGDNVIVITCFDEMVSGTLQPDRDGFTLQGPSGPRRLGWGEVRFMAHDGLPVRFLPDGTNQHLPDLQDTTKHRNILALGQQPSRIISGDPWVLEDCTTHLVNPHGPEGSSHEETVVLHHANGAKGLLWDLPTVYDVGMPVPRHL